MPFTWIVHISYITEGQTTVLTIHLKPFKPAIWQSNFSSHLALWRVFILDLGCTYSVCKRYHFLLGYLWKKWVTACQLSSKNQDLINITSWKRYWKWKMAEKKKRKSPLTRQRGTGCRLWEIKAIHSNSIRVMYSTCQLYVICQFKHDRKHAHWEEITSSFFTTNERLTRENKL